MPSGDIKGVGKEALVNNFTLRLAREETYALQDIQMLCLLAIKKNGYLHLMKLRF
jgi:hypothetical protein